MEAVRLPDVVRESARTSSCRDRRDTFGDAVLLEDPVDGRVAHHIPCGKDPLALASFRMTGRVTPSAPFQVDEAQIVPRP